MRNRVTGATQLNDVSSRSHAVFQIVIEKLFTDPSQTKQKSKITRIQRSKLCLVDLAGSERVSKSGTKDDGVRFKEATKINLSLLTLCNVISALTQPKQRTKHVPYRDSVLTKLLQDSLGGNSKTLMIASVSPCVNNYSETLSTLRYSNRAKRIKNKPVINEDKRDALLRKYEQEIAHLRMQLTQVQRTHQMGFGKIQDSVSDIEESANNLDARGTTTSHFLKGNFNQK
jgi:hypothetical protein